MEDTPVFIQAANMHSYAAGTTPTNEPGFFSGLMQSVYNAPKFFESVAISAGIGFVNTGVAVANLFNSEESKIEQISTAKWIQDYDNDLGAYYRENKSLVDGFGFALGSVVPGMAGVRALNVGQRALQAARTTGAMGANMSRATGLLVPATEARVAQAAHEIAKTSNGFRLLDANVLKALGSGVGQNALEAAAFEAFAIGAQFQSDFIKDSTPSEIVWNSLLGVGLGAGIGGLFTGRRSLKDIRVQVDELDKAGRGFVSAQAVPASVPSGGQIANAFNNKEAIEQTIARAEAGVVDDLTAKYISDGKQQISNLQNDIYTHVNKITVSAKGDLSKLAGDTLAKMPNSTGANLMYPAEAIVRIADVPIGLAKPTAKQGDLMLGSAPGKQAYAADTGVVWVRTTDGSMAKAGDMLDQMPSVAPLADTLQVKGKKSIRSALNEDIAARKFRPEEQFNVTAAASNLKQVQARYIWARELKNFKDGARILAGDFPLLEAALAKMREGSISTVNIVVRANDKAPTVFKNVDDLEAAIMNGKQAAADAMIEGGQPAQLVAAKLNMREGYVTKGEVLEDLRANFFADQSFASELGIKLSAYHERPHFIGIRGDSRLQQGISDGALEVELMLEQLRQAHQMSVDAAVSSVSARLGQLDYTDGAGKTNRGTLIDALPENKLWRDGMDSISRFGSGARLLSGANGNYGSLEALAQHIGTLKHGMDIAATKANQNTWGSTVAAMHTNPAAAVEFSVVNEMLAGARARYGIAPRAADSLEEGVMTLRPLEVIEAMEQGLPIPTLGEGIQPAIFIKEQTAADAIALHIKANADNLTDRTMLRAAEGAPAGKFDGRGYYPIKPDTSERPFWAIVVDESSLGEARKTMMHAGSAQELRSMVETVRASNSGIRVITDKTSKDFHKAIGDYEYSRTIKDLNFDVELANMGVSSQYLPQTDPKLVTAKIMNYHNRQSSLLNTDIVNTKYAVEFDNIRRLGSSYAEAATSRLNDPSTQVVQAIDNPFEQYIKTALNISNVKDYGFLHTTNTLLDSSVSAVWNKAANLMRNMKGVDDATIDMINATFKEKGFQTVTASAENYMLANHVADKRVLTRFMRTAQATLATTFLRWDALHALNNTMGSTIMMSAELRHLIDNTYKGDRRVAGKLVDFYSEVPGTDGSQVLSAGKLMANALRNSFDKELRDRAKSLGFVTDDLNRAYAIIDEMALSGRESVKEIQAKQAKILEGAKWLSDGIETVTGNKLSESLNRFMAYDVMRQVTDPLVDAGIMTAKEANVYANTFVNRTQVTLNAAQRPMAFQGPIGMAIGLFQSYQFNMFQQMFRYIGDGNSKAMIALAGLQGSFYGMASFPGFKFLNDSVIGTAKGNELHKDAYSELPSALGRGVSDMLLYGAPSAALGLAVFTRGDLTPQHPTVLPSSPSELPVIRMYSEIFNNIKRVQSNVGEGAGLWNSVLTGIEYNGFNRPLSGLATVFRGATDDGTVRSYDRTGSLVASHDLWHLSTLFRLAGGKPFDEAKVREEKWRATQYQRADSERRSKASEAMRLAFAGGDGGDQAMVSAFDTFMSTGGKAADFNRWALDKYAEANTEMSDRLLSSLSDNYAQRFQRVMGGM